MNRNINDFSLFNDLSIKNEEFDRKAYRVVPKDLWIYLEGDSKPHRVQNISFSGISFDLNKSEEGKHMCLGKLLTIYIFSQIHDDILTLPAKIIRIEENICSCFFPIIAARDQTILDKMILEIQKEKILQDKIEERKDLS